MLPIIGIAGNHRMDELDTENFVMSYTPDAFVKGIHQAKGLPFIIPISSESNVKEYVERIDGLLLTGGQDVCPLLYNEEPHCKLGTTYPLRDEFELELIREATRQKKPILGVCRGLQILNVAFGGTLYQDLNSQYPGELILHLQKAMPSWPTQTIDIDPQSFLSSILGTSAVVNSIHHQAVKELSDEFRAVAWTKDGVIEAFESKSAEHIVLAVQWHPEFMIGKSEPMQNIFNFFVEEVKKTI